MGHRQRIFGLGIYEELGGGYLFCSNIFKYKYLTHIVLKSV